MLQSRLHYFLVEPTEEEADNPPKWLTVDDAMLVKEDEEITALTVVFMKNHDTQQSNVSID